MLAADATNWTDLYLTALTQAGLLRPVDTPPEVRDNPLVTSLMATLASGLLAGPAGQPIITGGNLVQFFEQVRTWYGNDPTKTVVLETGIDKVNPNNGGYYDVAKLPAAERLRSEPDRAHAFPGFQRLRLVPERLEQRRDRRGHRTRRTRTRRRPKPRISRPSSA